MGREAFTPGKAYPIDDGVRVPVALPQDQKCLNCGEPGTVLELVDGVCFDPCRYRAYLQKEKR